jgi:FKBP-type peptidyl-prolyl cis-trans isomerase SlyD
MPGLMQITKHTVATIEYELTDDEGEVIDSSEGSGPLAYVHGLDTIIPGLEAELEGKTSGDAFRVRVPPEKGYGERMDEMVQSVSRTQMPAGVDIQVGMQFQAQAEDAVHVVTVVEVDAENVTLDANHPLAGMPLNFDVKVVEVRDATEEEIEHGHVHGPGGHEH